MANEISYATFLSNGGRVARVLSDALHVNLYDPSGLRALMDFKPFNGMGSATMNITKVTRGAAMAAASSEISGGASNTLLTTGNYDLTAARYILKMQPSDLFQITGGPVDVDYVTGVLVESLDLTLTNLLTALFANISSSVGTSGQNLSVNNWFDAIYTLNLALNGTDIAAVLHPQQVNDLIESARGETGPMQYRTDAQGILSPPGVGFRGSFAGVAIYSCDSVATANGGADRDGCMFSRGAFAYTLASVSQMGQMIDPADIIIGTDEMWVERDRDAPNGLTSLFANSYPATAEQEDARAVRIVTDA